MDTIHDGLPYEDFSTYSHINYYSNIPMNGQSQFYIGDDEKYKEEENNEEEENVSVDGETDRTEGGAIGTDTEAPPEIPEGSDNAGAGEPVEVPSEPSVEAIPNNSVTVEPSEPVE